MTDTISAACAHRSGFKCVRVCVSLAVGFKRLSVSVRGPVNQNALCCCFVFMHTCSCAVIGMHVSSQRAIRLEAFSPADAGAAACPRPQCL